LSLAVFQSIGPLELAIVLLIVLLIVGPKRLPGLGRQLGSGMREFKDSLTNKVDKDLDERSDDGSLDGEVVAERERTRS
jgi:sec-independent protein translocase protein TatA